MNLPRISIVTPSFNQGKYIEQTIRSVIDQDYPNLEYIIIDGGSTDNTVDIIKKYKDRVSYWVSEPDKGQTDAINKGYAKATGEIFNWLNSDDYYEPGSLKKIGNYFLENPAANVVCGKEWGFMDGKPGETTWHPGSIIRPTVFETIRVGIMDQPCTFFRKNAIAGFFPLDQSLRFVMDRQLWWAYLLKHGQEHILQVQEIFTWFRLHADSKSVSSSDEFEKEFDRLKYTLFHQLSAPLILLQQAGEKVQPLAKNFEISIGPKERILAAFARFYAERYYVKQDLSSTAALMRHVKRWKNGRMTKNEWKLWLIANFLPVALVKTLKKIKKGTKV